MEEVEALRSRVHKLADVVQAHDNTLHEHGIMHKQTDRELELLRSEKATRNELAAHETLIRTTMTAAADSLTIQLTHMREGQHTLQTAINWVVALVIGAVILAGLNLILHDGTARAEQPQSIDSPTRVR